jgi:outer membrane immunogenic protein
MLCPNASVCLRAKQEGRPVRRGMDRDARSGGASLGMRPKISLNSPAFAGAVALAAGIFANALACVLSAQAADLPAAPRPAPQIPVAYAPPVYDWSGFYVGGHLGGGIASSSWSDPFTGGSNTFNKGGFLGGGQVGFNSQFNWLVLGLEGDFSWTGLKSHGTDSLGDALTANTQWTSTVTGRVGAAFDRLLVYGKGGLAIAHDHDSLTDLALNTSSMTLTRTGWTAGAGVEYALNRNWSVRLEYDYLGFGAKALNFTTPALGTVTSNADLNVQEIKAGLNFKFGN